MKLTNQEVESLLSPFCKLWETGNHNRKSIRSTPDAPHEYQLSWYGINLAELLILGGSEPCIRATCIDTTPNSLHKNGANELGSLIGITDTLEDVILMWPEYNIAGNTMEFLIRGQRYASVTFIHDINFWMDNSDNADFKSSTTDIATFIRYSQFMQRRMDDIILQTELNILRKFTHLS